MSTPIPRDLTRDDVLQALRDLDAGTEHPFGIPTGYVLVHDGREYAPKAAVGLACRYRIGRMLKPEEFSGGEARGQANAVLRELGFTVQSKSNSDPVEAERQHRLDLWSALDQAGGPNGLSPGILREMGIYGGAQGIWLDKARTEKITQDGTAITVAVLHTGSSYADDLSEDCLIYHYPQTRRPAGRDLSEISATKAAGQLGIPLFVISYPKLSSAVRDVRLGWVESWDDDAQTFLISFGLQARKVEPEQIADDTPFDLVVGKRGAKRAVEVRSGQQRFKFLVIKRYGAKCAVCGLAVKELLDAAHICPKHAGGSDDPRNGLVLCANHHRAFDAGLFAIEPSGLSIHSLPDGPALEELGISVRSLTHLRQSPHAEALEWMWRKWKRSEEQ